MLPVLCPPCFLTGYLDAKGEKKPALLLELVSMESKLVQPLPAKAAKEVCRQILRALAHCHAKGVVHRDIKVGLWGTFGGLGGELTMM